MSDDRRGISVMAEHAVNVYDFDHTIYRGDASRDFILFCMLRQPRLIRYAPRQIRALALYVMGSFSRKQLKQEAFVFLRGVQNLESLLVSFWSRHDHKIAKWYQARHEASDLVISASPEFLLRGIAQKLQLAGVIATDMDPRSGIITGENCRGSEKTRRLLQYDPTCAVVNCYSDSLSDRPLLELAANPYIVKRNAIVPLQQYHPPKFQALSDRAFLRFILVGGINALLGVAFSYAFSLVLRAPTTAFVLGYGCSLVISYFLNAAVTFRDTSLSLGKFGKFCLSYIPNFIIQFGLVRVLVNVLRVYPLLAYIMAVIIAVPVTFLALSKYTFTKGGGNE